jgi:predicted DNA binding CopG/RHH family protein
VKNAHLNKTEKTLSNSFDRGEWRSVKNAAIERRMLQDAARCTLRKNARIKSQLLSKDLGDIQVIAAREGIPYQTLLSNVIHKFATEMLAEK